MDLSCPIQMYRWWKEKIQNEYINDEREENKNNELSMKCIKMMCGKYRTQNVNRYE